MNTERILKNISLRKSVSSKLSFKDAGFSDVRFLVIDLNISKFHKTFWTFQLLYIQLLMCEKNIRMVVVLCFVNILI